ncbi:MAG TPA: hydroxymethylglutaryl-CoA lyase, partial [Candidatus Dormibacteraeota bacterium]|nr:hydroxymethylglutaryl-CoA lyase [Candidatus Dormibacteraeota bacterium]
GPPGGGRRRAAVSGPRVVWTDVSPRDGLQNLADPAPTDVKVRLVRGLLAAGLPRVEAASFVSPRAVPQMADAAEVLRSLDGEPLGRLRVLVPNLRGFEDAVRSGVRNVVVTVAATDTFNRRNVRRSVAESLEELRRIVDAARGAGVVVDVALSVAFGCPFEGRVDRTVVVGLCDELSAIGAAEVCVADTIGVADPAAVRELCASLLDGHLTVRSLALHVHDTRGLGVANVVAAFDAGVRRFEGSAGGLGGCPFAPRSTGNVCTEDSIGALVALGAETGVDLEALCEVARRLGSDLGLALPGKLHRAGVWHPELAASA